MNSKALLNIQHLIFVLFILSNILNLFANRGLTAGSVLNEEADIGGRIYIQMVNVFILGLMTMSLLFNRNQLHFNIIFFKPLLIFLFLTYIYVGFNYILPNANFNLGQYVRLIMNITVIFYFNKLRLDTYIKPLMVVFILTFIIQICWKIISGEVFMSERLAAGDTASIGLVFLSPLILLFFRNMLGIVLIIICAAITVLSLRRTSMLAMVLALPFVWPFIKAHISKNILFIGFIGVFIGFVYAWDYIGDMLIYRFDEMVNGNENGSRGSGRDGFWVMLWDDFFTNRNILFGCGMGAIATFYYRIGWDFLPHAHNDFLEVMYTFGLFGLYIWLWFLFSFFVYTKKRIVEKDLRNLVWAAMVLYLFTGFASGCLVRYEFIPLGMSLGLLTNFNIKEITES